MGLSTGTQDFIPQRNPQVPTLLKNRYKFDPIWCERSDFHIGQV